MGTCNQRDLQDELSQINEQIYLSSYKTAQDFNKLKSEGITNILELFEVEKDHDFLTNFDYCTLPVPRGKNITILPVIPGSLKFIHGVVLSGKKILVHCKHGENRSVTVLIAYFMASKD